MSLDPVWITEVTGGPAIGRATPVSGLTILWAGASTTISTVNAASLSLADGRVAYSGQHPSMWGKVVRSNLDSVRGPNWPTGTDDVEVQGSDAVSFGAQTLSKAIICNSNGSTTVIS